MKLKMKQIGLAGALSVFTTLSNAAVLTYDNSGDLFLNPGTQTTYDFEESSGFPASSGTFTHIGMFDNINFDATVADYALSISGNRSMTGTTGSGSAASIDLSGFGSDVFGVGFWGTGFNRNWK